MPIFEFLCPSCNRIFSFLSLRLTPTRQPVCPRCGATDLTRVPSAFAVARGRQGPASSEAASAGPGGDATDQRLEHEAMRMAAELGEDGAEDPRVAARLMRRLAESSGEPVTATMEEMLRRLEAGEDPEALEDELGPQLEAEAGEDGGGAAAAPTRDDGLYDL